MTKFCDWDLLLTLMLLWTRWVIFQSKGKFCPRNFQKQHFLIALQYLDLKCRGERRLSTFTSASPYSLEKCVFRTEQTGAHRPPTHECGLRLTSSHSPAEEDSLWGGPLAGLDIPPDSHTRSRALGGKVKKNKKQLCLVSVFFSESSHFQQGLNLVWNKYRVIYFKTESPYKMRQHECLHLLGACKCMSPFFLWLSGCKGLEREAVHAHRVKMRWNAKNSHILSVQVSLNSSDITDLY